MSFYISIDPGNKKCGLLLADIQSGKVIEAGIALEEARKWITPAPIHIVSNINCKSSPVRMVIAPHQLHKVTKQSINDTLHTGHHGLPSIQDTILRF